MTPPERHQLTVRDQVFEVQRLGSGRPLAYFHDEFGNAWSDMVSRLAGDFNVAAPALPGFNGTPRPPWVDHVDDVAFFLVDVLEELFDGEPCDVVGSSLGAWLALETAIRAPHAVKRLVLIGCMGLDVPEDPPADPFVLTPDERAALYFDNPPDVIPVEELLQLRNEAMTARLVWQPRFVSPKLAFRVHRVRAPSLVLWGRNDRLVSVEHGRALAALLPHGTFDIVEETGHFPDLERAEESAGRVMAFLNGGVVR